MNPTKSSLLASAGVTLAALAVVFGSSTRERLDIGNLGERSINLGGLVASKDDIPEGDYFREMVHLLKREYVDPIGDDRKLAIGAIKGMVNSLKDSRCLFMDPGEFRAYMNAINGKYEGIGADLVLDMKVSKGHGNGPNADQMQPSDVQALAIPRLTVVAVVPGGPAGAAGVRPGDWVDSVNDHWVLNPQLVEKFRAASQAAAPAATKALKPDQVKQRQAAARRLGVELRNRLKTMIMPLKAKDLLTQGSDESVKVVWHRGDKVFTTSLLKKTSEVELVQGEGNVISLRFGQGSSEALKAILVGKRDITLDMRNNATGSFEEMRECLSLLAPAGNYGEVHSDKPGKSKPLSISSGNPKPPRLSILVDNSTRGPAEIFAKALASKGIARVSGQPSGDTSVVQAVALPDGSGYTLVMGEYQTKSTKAVKRVALQTGAPPRPMALREMDGSIIAMLSAGGNS